jgi:hypothetical protein
MSFRVQPRPVLGLAVGAGCAALAYGAAFSPALQRPAAWLMVAAIVAMVDGALALGSGSGVSRRGGRMAALCLGAGFAAALLLPADAPRIHGVPLGSVVMMILVGALPLIGLPLAFARGFDASHRGAHADQPPQGNRGGATGGANPHGASRDDVGAP